MIDGAAATPVGARVSFVGDNRDNPNWGSRATSMALLDGLESVGLAPCERLMDSEVQTIVPMFGRSAEMDKMLNWRWASRAARAAIRRGGRSAAALERSLGLTDAVLSDPDATVAAWLQRPARSDLTRLLGFIRDSDLLVINGEGSMIFTAEPRREQRLHLALMCLAVHFGVPFAYVNALVSDPPSGVRNDVVREATARILEKARLVTARDPESLRYLEALSPQIPARFVPDAVFTWFDALAEGAKRNVLATPDFLVPFHMRPDELGRWRFEEPYICVGGSSEAAKTPVRSRAAYRLLLKRLAAIGLPVVVTVSCLGDAFLQELAVELGMNVIPPTTNVWTAASILGGAEIVVSGRYHPTIFAGLRGVPAVVLGADSHKSRSVQEVLGYPQVRVFPAVPDAEACESVVEVVEARLRDREVWSSAIREVSAQRSSEAGRLAAMVRAAVLQEDVTVRV